MKMNVDDKTLGLVKESLTYVINNERTHYQESTTHERENHIYLSALTAYNQLFNGCGEGICDNCMNIMYPKEKNCSECGYICATPLTRILR